MPGFARGHSCPYEVVCERGGDGWEVAGSNGPGWRPADGGMLTYWDSVEGRSEPIRVEVAGREHPAEVNRGYFFVALRDTPQPAADSWPRLVA